MVKIQGHKEVISPVEVVATTPEAEQVLIRQAKAGDVDAFESLIVQHQKKIYNLAVHLTGDKEHAQDITQEALVKAFRYIKKFQGKSAFSTWLYRIVRNVFLDDLKKSYRKHDSQHVSLNGKYDLANGAGHRIEDISEVQILKNVVHQSLAKLPLKLRTALVMYELQGFSYQEISGVERTSEGTIKSRISKARKLLSQEPALQRYWQDIK